MTATNQVYPLAVEAIMRGEVDLLGDTIRVVLLDAGYTYNAGHEFLDDVPGGARLATKTLSGKSVAGGLFTADDAEFVAVPDGDTITGYVAFQSTGVEATSRLLAYIVRRGDTVPLATPTNGGDITLRFPSGIFKL